MKIEKRSSDSYRVRKMYKGQVYTVSFDHKPTQKEAMQAMAAELDKVKTAASLATFQAAAESYVDAKRNILSPKTVKEYSETVHRLPDWFRRLPLLDITQAEINKLVNELSKGRSPKTVRNYHGFLTAVLGTFRPELRISTTLPQKVKKEPYIPSQEDVQRILSSLKGSPYEIPILLACYGMRRSEICALQADDIDGDVVHISKAMVQNDQKEWVIKATKTTESTRSIVIPLDLADKIRAQGYVYKGHPGGITKHLERVEDNLNIPRFPLHKLRHYFASMMSALGVPEADIMHLGGWRTDRVMKAVYRHAMMDKNEDAKREAAEKLRNALFS